MSNTETLYVRIPAELKEQIAKRAEAKGAQLNEVVGQLLEAGLQVEALMEDVTEKEAELGRAREQLRSVQSQVQRLEADRTRDLAIVDTAKHEAAQLNALLDRPTILKCGHCTTTVSIRDLAAGICPQCGWSRFELRPEFATHPQPSIGEIVKTGLAVVGGVATLVALLNTLVGGSSQRS